MGGELYLILGIGESAAQSEIRKAYRRLARKYHPDINPGDQNAQEFFSRISDAYDVLSDPEKRGFYDRHGYYSESTTEEVDGSRWDFSFGEEKAPDSFDFRDMVEGFFGSKSPTGEPETSGDAEVRVSLTFRESMSGLSTDVELNRQEVCGGCVGSGRPRNSSASMCAQCSGQGRVVRARGHLRFSTSCRECGGTGRVRRACSQCGGSGRTNVRERVRVEIPPGVGSGSRLRLPGQGHFDPRTGEHGDLWVVTNVSPHPYFRRAGDNLYCTVPITISEAALGGKVTVPTIDGLAVLRVPPGVQPGQTIRLRGKGAPSLRADGARGDQYVEIQVVVPRVVDERSREILRELAELHPGNPRKELESHAR